jgi:hypothetical protein
VALVDLVIQELNNFLKMINLKLCLFLQFLWQMAYGDVDVAPCSMLYAPCKNWDNINDNFRI